MISPDFAASLDALFFLVAACGLGLVLQLFGWRGRLLALVKAREEEAVLTAEIASVATAISEPKTPARPPRRARPGSKTKKPR